MSRGNFWTRRALRRKIEEPVKVVGPFCHWPRPVRHIEPFNKSWRGAARRAEKIFVQRQQEGLFA